MNGKAAALGALFLLLSQPPSGRAWSGSTAVGLKNQDALAVSAPVGEREGLTPETDLEVLAPDGTIVTVLYPHELYSDRFWSQPLAPEVFARIQVGMSLRSAALTASAHQRLRRDGAAQAAELAASREEERREVLRAELAGLRAQRGRAMDRRDALDARLEAAERDLLAAEDRMNAVVLGEEGDLDRALADLEDLLDERDELQSQRETLAQEDPFPKAEVERLTQRVKRLADRVESQRRRLRAARDRSRSARAAYLDTRLRWKELQAERAALERELRALTERTRELSAELSGGR